jgi:cobyrinic acid a,c-diamide synthase
MKCPRLVIAGTQSGVGKTTVSIGLMAAIAKRMNVQAFKVGPDYIDPTYHTFVTGRKSRNLDSWMIDSSTLTYLFQKSVTEADMAIIEGVMGLYDGFGIEKDKGATAHVAKILKAPIILVIDGKGISSSAAAIVLGYKGFDSEVDLAGVIINRVSGESHYQLLKESIERYANVKVFGYLPEDIQIELPSRHLGLVPIVEIESLKEKLENLVCHIEKTIDVDELICFSRKWDKQIDIVNFSVSPVEEKDRIHIAVAYDKAFNFYYWDNLELLQDLGVKLEFFSPLKDQSLPPQISGLYLGGGFPEVFAQELQDNIVMKKVIRNLLKNGLPYFAECGGLMYLANSIRNFDGKTYEMVGWFNGNCHMTQKLQRFGYVQLKLTQNCVLGKKGSGIRAHEFHRSVSYFGGIPTVYQIFKERPGKESGSWSCGYIQGNGIAGYPHIHFYSNTDFARNFVVAARNYIEGLRK